MPMIKRGSRNCSKGDSAKCDGGGSDVDKSYKRVPLGNARGENISAKCQDQRLSGCPRCEMGRTPIWPRIGTDVSKAHHAMRLQEFDKV